jgi:ABC-type multidrug transport system fused ATPase/permease subunit
MDYRYAQLKSMYADIVVTTKNKEDFIDPDRAIQCPCLAGFYCPDAQTMLVGALQCSYVLIANFLISFSLSVCLPTTSQICPRDHWCPERSVVPIKCDAFSACGSEGNSFQVNFINALIMTILVVLSFGTGFLLLIRQQKQEKISRQKEPNSRKEKSVLKGDSNNHPGVLNISFRGVHFRTRSNRVILPGISGKIPAGKISAILGPTSW